MQEVFVKAAFEVLSSLTYTLMIYLNFLENFLSDPFVLPNGTKLSSLLYGDDLIILSRSKAGLQNCLNALAQYCRSWMLNIDKKKPKLSFFNDERKNMIVIFI